MFQLLLKFYNYKVKLIIIDLFFKKNFKITISYVLISSIATYLRYNVPDSQSPSVHNYYFRSQLRVGSEC